MRALHQGLRPLKRWLKRGYNRLTETRSSGLAEEVGFWDEWFRTRGSNWPEEYARRLDSGAPLADCHRSFIDHLPQTEIRILDVGAGPLTLIGKTHPTKRLVIVATDVLAEQYDVLLGKYGVEPPVRTLFADAEKLADQFGDESFDFVNAVNCIDHTANPIEAVRQMIRVVKTGCFVFLSHAQNEAENQLYAGLHQWNLVSDSGDFVVKGRRQSTNVSRELASLAEFSCQTNADSGLHVQIRKKQALPAA